MVYVDKKTPPGPRAAPSARATATSKNTLRLKGTTTLPVWSIFRPSLAGGLIVRGGSTGRPPSPRTYRTPPSPQVPQFARARPQTPRRRSPRCAIPVARGDFESYRNSHFGSGYSGSPLFKYDFWTSLGRSDLIARRESRSIKYDSFQAYLVLERRSFQKEKKNQNDSPWDPDRPLAIISGRSKLDQTHPKLDKKSYLNEIFGRSTHYRGLRRDDDPPRSTGIHRGRPGIHRGRHIGHIRQHRTHHRHHRHPPTSPTSANITDIRRHPPTSPHTSTSANIAHIRADHPSTEAFLDLHPGSAPVFRPTHG
ncbi:hypothetical protein T492DRAFT_842939 [Pavlovales sp. CCMP2436]|nr:hypothetical protein T492DRAFT_842939 [Pavlovales sp. CCMP2436]